jgi:alpha-galactosidase
VADRTPALPDAAYVVHEDREGGERARRRGERFATAGVEISFRAEPEGLTVVVAAPPRPHGHDGLSRVVLRWRHRLPSSTLVLGDAWERSYGDLQWRHLQPDRVLPWSWLAYDEASGHATGMGVRVRPRAFCAWTVDERGCSLWLDLRNGGAPVRLGERVLDAATVVAVDGQPGESPYALQRRLTAAMCSDPLPVREPVVGANNWYYAYGVGFGPEQVLADTETIVELADGHPVKPFSVIDAGWSPGGTCPGGPWTAGLPGTFDDMPGLAAAIAARGARPGIWMRPAALSFVDDPRRLRPGPRPAKEQPLDISLAENLQTIRDDVARLVGWGFELVKHDFSTFDAFGRWGPAMGVAMTEPGWHFADRSRTNAELLLGLYEAIRDGAGDAVLIGCNTVGHLAAGLVEVQRTGDDTSGRDWERTRRMGVNTLAFRLAQHRTFFVVDPDCVPCTLQTPWERNRQFLDLVARSGTALFVSVDPAARSPRVDADLRAALRLALDGGEPGGVEPLDWLHATTPARWRTGTTEREYDWIEPSGAWLLAP